MITSNTPQSKPKYVRYAITENGMYHMGVSFYGNEDLIKLFPTRQAAEKYITTFYRNHNCKVKKVNLL